MPRAKTPSFVTTIELAVSQRQEKVLLARLEAARQVYNACLGETLKRSRLVKQSKAYHAACKLPKTTGGKPNKERSKAFAAVNKTYSFSEYALHSFAAQFSRSWLGEHLDCNSVQTVATRAFKTAFDHQTGLRGKPRFKGKNQFDSVEGKSNKSGLMLRDREIRWKGLALDLLVPDGDKVIEHGLNAKVKYVRLVRRKIRGKNRFYAQLINEGDPYQKDKNVIGTKTVGLDIGPSTLAIVTDESARLDLLCADINDRAKVIAKLQRAVERQRRLGNLNNYGESQWKPNANGRRVLKKGKIKKGRHIWQRSSRMQAQQNKLYETQRKLAAHRKSLHGALINDILALGADIKTEKLSYKAFQKLYGKSVGMRAPGMLISWLGRKAARAGGSFYEFGTRTTRLSQTCHGCGEIKKKALKDRWHLCETCSIEAQRDLYSAFLACYVESDPVTDQPWLNAASAQKAWRNGTDHVLQAALGHLSESSNARPRNKPPLPQSFGLSKARRQRRSLALDCNKAAQSRDVVPVPRLVQRELDLGDAPSRTPCL